MWGAVAYQARHAAAAFAFSSVPFIFGGLPQRHENIFVRARVGVRLWLLHLRHLRRGIVTTPTRLIEPAVEPGYRVAIALARLGFPIMRRENPRYLLTGCLHRAWQLTAQPRYLVPARPHRVVAETSGLQRLQPAINILRPRNGHNHFLRHGRTLPPCAASQPAPSNRDISKVV